MVRQTNAVSKTGRAFVPQHRLTRMVHNELLYHVASAHVLYMLSRKPRTYLAQLPSMILLED
jgi:hypothetical protein